MTTPSDILRAAEAPANARCAAYTFLVDTGADSFTPTAGVYEVYNSGSVLAWLRVGSAPAIPADQATEELGVVFVPPGAVVTMEVDGVLHGATASSSATLYLLRKVS